MSLGKHDELIDKLIKMGKLVVILPPKNSGLQTRVWMRDDRLGKGRSYREVISWQHKEDYVKTTIWWKGRNYHLFVARIVMVSWFGKPIPDKEVHHKNGDRTNYNWWNLECWERLEHIELHKSIRNGSYVPEEDDTDNEEELPMAVPF
jgi:hypothetical protein